MSANLSNHPAGVHFSLHDTIHLVCCGMDSVQHNICSVARHALWKNTRECFFSDEYYFPEEKKHKDLHLSKNTMLLYARGACTQGRPER